MEASPHLPLFPILCVSPRPRLPTPSSLLAPHIPECPFFRRKQQRAKRGPPPTSTPPPPRARAPTRVEEAYPPLVLPLTDDFVLVFAPRRASWHASYLRAQHTYPFTSSPFLHSRATFCSCIHGVHQNCNWPATAFVHGPSCEQRRRSPNGLLQGASGAGWA